MREALRTARRRRPVGAELVPGGTHFRVWAPGRKVTVVLEDDGGKRVLDPEPGGYASAAVAGVGVGTKYRFCLDDHVGPFPDPASRFQPDGPHGPSEVVNPSGFAWSDGAWPGLRIAGRVIYEMHVGTFTPAGTWAAAAEKLPHLAETGINVIEMMPVADFPGRFGWGYDGVNLFAPTRLYGRPDDLRRFIDAAHRHGIGVILDVVYNHLGPDGNYLSCFSPAYFSDRHATEWGAAINFDDPDSGPVREFFIDNAAYWIDEYHFDGLRFDATQSIFDGSEPHVLREMVSAARKAAGPRSIILVGENEPQDVRLVRSPEEGGFGLDALWNDDLHHSAMVALTGRAEAYYADHVGTPQEFISAAKYGFLFQGQVYAHQRKRRGTPGLDVPASALVTFLQNHDQIANSASGRRIHELADPGAVRALTALILLMPGTPMLFQGQEFWSSSRFYYFCDHNPELARLVRDGRIQFLRQFPSIEADAEVRETLAPPQSSDTFLRSKIDWADLHQHQEAFALHRDLLRLRSEDPVLSRQSPEGLDGTVLGPDVFALRLFGVGGDDRLIIVNLGRDFLARSIPDPLVAPPSNSAWSLLWSSERPAYGGAGTPTVETANGWRVPARAAILLAPQARDAAEPNELDES